MTSDGAKLDSMRGIDERLRDLPTIAPSPALDDRALRALDVARVGRIEQLVHALVAGSYGIYVLAQAAHLLLH